MKTKSRKNARKSDSDPKHLHRLAYVAFNRGAYEESIGLFTQAAAAYSAIKVYDLRALGLIQTLRALAMSRIGWKDQALDEITEAEEWLEKSLEGDALDRHYLVLFRSAKMEILEECGFYDDAYVIWRDFNLVDDVPMH